MKKEDIFGLYLKSLREEKGLTIFDVAKEVDISTEQLERWERGEDFIELEDINKLAYLYEIEPTELLGHRQDDYEEVTKKYQKILDFFKEHKNLPYVILLIAVIISIPLIRKIFALILSIITGSYGMDGLSLR